MYVGAYIKVKMPEYEDESDYKICPECGKKSYSFDAWCSRDGARMFRETVTKYVNDFSMLENAFGGEEDVLTSCHLSEDLSVVAFYSNHPAQGGLHFSDEENAEFQIPADNRENADYRRFIEHMREIGAEFEVKFGILTDSVEM